MDIEDTKDKELIELNQKIDNAKKEEGDIELRNAYAERAEYFFNKGQLDESVESYLLALEKTAGVLKKLEYNLVVLQIYFTQRKIKQFSELLTTCKKLDEEGGDWEKKNKLLVYDGIWHVIKRDFHKAADIFLSCVNTFNAPEIIDFKQLVFYGVVLGMVTLHRKDIRKKILDNSEIVSILREDPLLEGFINAFYGREYGRYFSCLSRVNS